VSHEPHPRTDRTTPGSTPAPGELPAEERADRGEHEVPPSESVPDEVAERAAQAEDPLASGPDRTTETGPPTPGRDVTDDDVMHPHPASSDVHGVPGGDV
jgi:hypothetical protein